MKNPLEQFFHLLSYAQKLLSEIVNFTKISHAKIWAIIEHSPLVPPNVY